VFELILMQFACVQRLNIHLNLRPSVLNIRDSRTLHRERLYS